MSGLLPALLLITGCTWRMAVESDPPGAVVTVVNDGGGVVAPDTIVLKYHPIAGAQWVRVTAPGHRDLEVNLRKSMPLLGLRYITDPVLHPNRTFGDKAHGEVRFLLVPRHDPTGTWHPADEGLE